MNNSPYLDADMHHKICKKMAQLTRVIHEMNSQNLQCNLMLKDTIKEYENEIDRVVTECNALITKTKQAAEKNAKKEDIKDKIKKLESDLDAEKKKSKKEFEALKAKVEDRERKGASDTEVGFS